MTQHKQPSQNTQNLKHRDTHYLFLPGLHGTNHLYQDLIYHLGIKESYHSITTINYPQNLNQSYNTLFSWLCAETKLDQAPSDNYTQTVIIAESFSTPLAIRLTQKYPLHIKALIIAGGFCTSPVPLGKFLAHLPIRPLFSIPPPRLAVKLFLTGTKSTTELIDKVRSTVSKSNSKNLTQRVKNILNINTTSLPKNINTPTLIIHAKQDRIIPTKTQNQLNKHLPHAETHLIKSPHLIYQTHPKLSANLIKSFISKTHNHHTKP